MPIYVYSCTKCDNNGSSFEKYVDYQDRDNVICPACGGEAKRNYAESCLFAAHNLPNGHIAARAK